MVEFVGTAISGDDGEGKWFYLKVINPAILISRNWFLSKLGIGKSNQNRGEIKLTFDDKITADLKARLGNEYFEHLNKKRVIIKFE
tara:strand:- start:525 stop:782 length:258 start_codon:yes stop_codon:yes gene_type:complete